MKGSLRRLMIALVALSVCGCRSTFTPLPPKETRSYQSILEWSHENGMPGAILLVQTPRTNFLGAIGWADLKKKIPLRTDDAFRIGSLTKTFVSLVAAEMEAEGTLDGSAVITNYLPASITGHIRNSDRITVQQLLRHTSGIYNFEYSRRFGLERWFLDRRGAWPALRMLKYSFDQPAANAPGERFNYCDSNLVLAALIEDRLLGHPHPAEIRRRFLDPLQLTNTYYELSEPPRGERAHGYEWPLGFRDDTYDWTPTTGGAAGMVSTVSDLARFVRAIAGTNNFLNEATRRIMKGEPSPGVDPAAAVSRFMVRYDFGITPLQSSTNAPWFYGHRGVTAGGLCFAFHEPQEDITIVYFGSSAQLRVYKPLERTIGITRRLEDALFEMAVAQTQGGAP